MLSQHCFYLFVEICKTWSTLFHYKMFLLLKHQKVQTKQNTTSAQVASTGHPGQKTLKGNGCMSKFSSSVAQLFFSFFLFVLRVWCWSWFVKNLCLYSSRPLFSSVSTEMIIGGSGSFQSVTSHLDTLPESLTAFSDISHAQQTNLNCNVILH